MMILSMGAVLPVVDPRASRGLASKKGVAAQALDFDQGAAIVSHLMFAAK
jgi:hypothetical protein